MDDMFASELKALIKEYVRIAEELKEIIENEL